MKLFARSVLSIKQRLLATMIFSKAILIKLLSKRRSNIRKLRRKMDLLLRQKSHLIAQRLSLKKKKLLSQLFLRNPQSKTRMLLPRQDQLNQCMWPPLLEPIFLLNKLFLKKVKSLTPNPKLLRLMKHQMSRPLQLFNNNKFQWKNLNHLQCLIRPQCLQ